jgi:hypothetical protein
MPFALWFTAKFTSYIFMHASHLLHGSLSIACMHLRTPWCYNRPDSARERALRNPSFEAAMARNLRKGSLDGSRPGSAPQLPPTGSAMAFPDGAPGSKSAPALPPLPVEVGPLCSSCPCQQDVVSLEKTCPFFTTQSPGLVEP